MKKTRARLTLNRETIVRLESLERVAGGLGNLVSQYRTMCSSDVVACSFVACVSAHPATCGGAETYCYCTEAK